METPTRTGSLRGLLLLNAALLVVLAAVRTRQLPGTRKTGDPASDDDDS